MKDKYISFDIEISDEFDLKEGEDLDKYAPFHISVAAAVDSEGGKRLWYSSGADQIPLLNIARTDARHMLDYLLEKQSDGWKLFAWNGLSFDLRWIGYNAGDMETAARIAMNLYDPMFQFFNQKGFPVSLAAVGKAMGVRQEKLMAGADAPREWRQGHHQRVMDYVTGDCEITSQIVEAIDRQGRVMWHTRRGKLSYEAMPRFKTVAEVMCEPEPDQSWMTGGGLKRKKFTGWLPAGVVAEFC